MIGYLFLTVYVYILGVPGMPYLLVLPVMSGFGSSQRFIFRLSEAKLLETGLYAGFIGEYGIPGSKHKPRLILLYVVSLHLFRLLLLDDGFVHLERHLLLDFCHWMLPLTLLIRLTGCCCTTPLLTHYRGEPLEVGELL